MFIEGHEAIVAQEGKKAIVTRGLGTYCFARRVLLALLHKIIVA